ncbi:YkgJ family cysteine cluster protein [Herbaspirillum camelliae]|uniref:YkgJ family cysteine cluster protein n=1 Tax=Herbaspirillum camelliae TaxID=1892903 RepID=UPI00094A07FE|nr:YkgJ family cysteine cluster protein [Herbaspirillum camelliae]
MPSFPCLQCGLCCQHVDLAEQTRFLDRGDGVCRHYDAPRKACSIYDGRPDICRVDLQYTLHYAQHHTWEEFVELNLQVCSVLQKKHDVATDAVVASGNTPG